MSKRKLSSTVMSEVEIVGMIGILLAKIGLYISCSFKDLFLIYVCVCVSLCLCMHLYVNVFIGQKMASDVLKL